MVYWQGILNRSGERRCLKPTWQSILLIYLSGLSCANVSSTLYPQLLFIDNLQGYFSVLFSSISILVLVYLTLYDTLHHTKPTDAHMLLIVTYYTQFLIAWHGKTATNFATFNVLQLLMQQQQNLQNKNKLSTLLKNAHGMNCDTRETLKNNQSFLSPAGQLRAHTVLCWYCLPGRNTTCSAASYVWV